MKHDLVATVRRGLQKPPRVIWERLVSETRSEAERFLAPRRARRMTGTRLLEATDRKSLAELWDGLAMSGYPCHEKVHSDVCDRHCSGEAQRILEAASRALGNRIDLLGSGPVDLGANIDWHRDCKTGKRWEPRYFRDIDYRNPELPSDVKMAWEVSRLQWLIPAGQAYLLNGDERYSIHVRRVLEHWIRSNPYACSVNWACTMEPALRILSWTWFFRVFSHSQAWSDPGFRETFLTALYLHGDFVLRFFERTDINGNHCTADGAALVFAGLFFPGAEASRWLDFGWNVLCQEIELQVFPDGVDFEASVPYHRLVCELFFLAALYRERRGLPVPDRYRRLVIQMGRFTAAYTKPDGMCPLWGDADDARALPFGGQNINDHRYLPAIIGLHWGVSDLIDSFSGDKPEVFWLLGPEACEKLPAQPTQPRSTAFQDGGFFVMRGPRDHVFIDCGPIGLGGRGGHGHNDCLAFEAYLDGTPLVSDCGAYLYTASFAERNNFRSTAYHNTPSVDGAEANRFIQWDYLWNLHYDAKPELRRWESNGGEDYFEGAHHGYHKLDLPVTPVRSIRLDRRAHRLTVHDRLEGHGQHEVEIPLHLAPSVEFREVDGLTGEIDTPCGAKFTVKWTEGWRLEQGKGRVSPSYGVLKPVVRLAWKRVGMTPMELTVEIEPAK